MDEYKKKKSRNYKGKRPPYKKRIINGGMLGGGSHRPRPPSFPSRRNYGHNAEQKNITQQEKSHWNGKVEMWTEPQKPRQQKIVKYEVDTDKLLRELAEGNKETLNEITERLEREVKLEPTDETETLKKTDDAEKLTDDAEKLTDDAEKLTDESASEVSEETELEARKQTDENSEQAETGQQDENLTGESEDETHEDAEAEPQPEDVNESQEISQDTEPEPESSQEDPLDAPELVYMNPSFWEQLESEMSDELEQLEQEEEFEISPEESEPIEEGY